MRVESSPEAPPVGAWKHFSPLSECSPRFWHLGASQDVGGFGCILGGSGAVISGVISPLI